MGSSWKITNMRYDMKLFATYLRVSTQKQGQTQLGLSSQRNMCDVFIKEHKGILGMEFLDVESGTHRDRKGLWGAINYCQKNNCPLVIATLSRLARDVEFCFKVINTGIEIHFCDMPTINTLLLGVFASVAQYERELTSDRTKKALAVKKAQGAKLGAASEIYQINRKKKTYEEREKEDMKKGVVKCQRYLESRDVVAFVKVLRRCFPDATEGELEAWDWQGINTKKENRIAVLNMMRDYKDLDPEGKVFIRWDFSDIESVKLQVRLSSYIKSLHRSVMASERHKAMFNEQNEM